MPNHNGGVELPTSRYNSEDEGGPVNLPSVIENFTAYLPALVDVPWKICKILIPQNHTNHV